MYLQASGCKAVFSCEGSVALRLVFELLGLVGGAAARVPWQNAIVKAAPVDGVQCSSLGGTVRGNLIRWLT